MKSYLILSLVLLSGIAEASDNSIFTFGRISASGNGCRSGSYSVSAGVLDRPGSTQGSFEVKFREFEASNEDDTVSCTLSMPVKFTDKSRRYRFAIRSVTTTYKVNLPESGARAHAFYQASFPGTSPTDTVQDFFGTQRKKTIRRTSRMGETIYSPCGKSPRLRLSTTLSTDSEEGSIAISKQGGDMVAYMFVVKACD